MRDALVTITGTAMYFLSEKAGIPKDSLQPQASRVGYPFISETGRATAFGKGLLRSFSLLVVCFTFFLAGCSQKEELPLLKFGANGLWPGYAGFFMASDLDYFSGKHILVRDYHSSLQTIRAYHRGNIDVAALSLDEALLLMQGDPNAKIILLLDYSNGGSAIVAQPEIKDFNALDGKEVGVETDRIGNYLMYRALNVVKPEKDGFTTTPLEADYHKEAFEKKEVDAIITFEPLKSYFVKKGGNVLFDSSQIPGEIMGVLVVREWFLKNHESLVLLLEGWYRALKYMKKHPTESAELLSRRTGLTPEEYLQGFKGFELIDLKTNRALMKDKNSSFYENMRHLNDYMTKMRLIRQSIDYSNVINTSPLDDLD